MVQRNSTDAHPIQPSFPDTDPVRDVPPRRMDKSSFPPNLNGTNHYFRNVSGCAGRSRIRAWLRPVDRDTPPRVQSDGEGDLEAYRRFQRTVHRREESGSLTSVSDKSRMTRIERVTTLEKSSLAFISSSDPPLRLKGRQQMRALECDGNI